MSIKIGYEYVSREQYIKKQTQIEHARSAGKELIANTMHVLGDLGYEYKWGRYDRIKVYKRIFIIFRKEIAVITTNNKITSNNIRYDDEVRILHKFLNARLNELYKKHQGGN